MGLLLNSSMAVAQGSFYEERHHTFYGALIIGGAFSQVDGDNYKGYHKAGLQAGGGVYTFLGERMFAGMEILYTQKGSKGYLNTTGVPGITLQKYTIVLNYAEIPIQLYYKDNHWNHFGLGLTYSRLVNGDERMETYPGHNFNQEQFPFKKNDLSFTSSANICVWKGLFLSLRFQYSLVPVRDEVPYGLGRYGQYNNSCMARVMYVFGK